MRTVFDKNGVYDPLVGKCICLTDIHGKAYIGKVLCRCRADENDSGEDSIGLSFTSRKHWDADFDRSEILSIEILDDNEIPERLK